MNSRYILAPHAAQDLVDIWLYIKQQSSESSANRVESVIRNRIAFLSGSPGAGHWRKDLTDETGEILSRLFILDRLSSRDKAVASSLYPSWPT